MHVIFGCCVCAWSKLFYVYNCTVYVRIRQIRLSIYFMHCLTHFNNLFGYTRSIFFFFLFYCLSPSLLMVCMHRWSLSVGMFSMQTAANRQCDWNEAAEALWLWTFIPLDCVEKSCSCYCRCGCISTNKHLLQCSFIIIFARNFFVFVCLGRSKYMVRLTWSPLRDITNDDYTHLNTPLNFSFHTDCRAHKSEHF